LNFKEPVENQVLVDIPNAYSGHDRCFICGPKAIGMTSLFNLNKSLFNSFFIDKTKKLRLLKWDAIVDVFIARNIYIRHGARCCSKHLDDTNYFIKQHEFGSIQIVKRNVTLNNEQTKVKLVKI
jgi:hypothetical protein